MTSKFNKFKVAKSIRVIAYNLVQVYDEVLKDNSKLGTITDEERKVVIAVIDKICEPLEVGIIDHIKILEAQRSLIEQLKEQLFQQSLQLDTSENRNRIDAIVNRNSELETLVASLQDKIQLVANDEPKDERMQQVKTNYISELVLSNNGLKAENERLVARLGELNELEKLGQKMKEQQNKGRKQNKKIEDSKIKILHDLGFKPYQILKTLEADGKVCSLQTIINRLNKMGLRKESEAHV